MNQRLLSVLRRPEMVTAVVSVRRRPFSLDNDFPPYAELSVPLSQVLISTCPWKDRDVSAWRSLGGVPTMSKRAALAVIRCLVATVADPDNSPNSLPAVDPAKPPTDLRPYLCSAEHEQHLIDSLGGVLSEVSGDLRFPDWHWHRRQELAALPRLFRRLCLWSLHLSPWAALEDVLSAHMHLQLEDDPVLASCFARLLSLAGPKRAVEWAGVLALCKAARRPRAAELVIESGAVAQSPDDESAAAILEAPWPRALDSLMRFAGSPG